MYKASVMVLESRRSHECGSYLSHAHSRVDILQNEMSPNNILQLGSPPRLRLLLAATVTNTRSVIALRQLRRHITGRRDIEGWVRGKEIDGQDRDLQDLNGPEAGTVSSYMSVVDLASSTYMTGQSSTRGLCVRPKTLHTTTSVCKVSSLRAAASASPPVSVLLCSVYGPPAYSSSSRYLVTQRWCCANRARLACMLFGSASSFCVGGVTILYPTGLPLTGLVFSKFWILNTRLLNGAASRPIELVMGVSRTS